MSSASSFISRISSHSLTISSRYSSSGSSTSSGEAPSFIEYKESFLATIPSLLYGLGMEATNLSYLAKGHYNIVFSFDLQQTGEILESEKEEAPGLPCVIRISHVQKYDDEEDAEETFAKEIEEACKSTRDQAAILKLVHQHLSMTPELLHVDATTKNAIARPYTIQTRLPGQPLADVWEELNLDTKKEVVEQLSSFFVQAESIRFPICGQLCGVSSSDLSATKPGLIPFGQKKATAISEIAHKHMTIGQQCKKSLENRPLEGDSYFTEEYLAREAEAWEVLSSVLDQVVEEPSLSKLMSANANAAVLKHGDLHMGNIMFASIPRGDGGPDLIKIGIIDWDNTQAMPLTLARTPPTFLWQSQLDQTLNAYGGWDGNPDQTPRELRGFVDEPDGAELKAYFEECMLRRLEITAAPSAGKQWLEDVYGEGVWVRRVADICFDSLDSSIVQIEAAEQLAEEWEEGYCARCAGGV